MPTATKTVTELPAWKALLAHFQKVGRLHLRELLLVRQHRNRLRAKEIIVPDGEQPHQHWQVALEWSGAEMLVNLMKAAEHGAKAVRADSTKMLRDRLLVTSKSRKRPVERARSLAFKGA